MHDAGPQLPIDTVMGQRMRIKGTRVQVHIAVVITNRRCVNVANAGETYVCAVNLNRCRSLPWVRSQPRAS